MTRDEAKVEAERRQQLHTFIFRVYRLRRIERALTPVSTPRA